MLTPRIGQGMDVHRLVEGRPLILGGINIDSPLGLLGHSDADVLTHAIIDAVLGALALGDIGSWFPDNDAQYKNADSLMLLKSVLQDEKLSNWHLVNLDATIVAQAPKMAPFILDMRKNYATLFNADISRISIKATTTEKLGFCGRSEGISAHAIVMLTDDVEERG